MASEIVKIKLSGDWTIDSIAEQYGRLKELRLPEETPMAMPVVIDVGEITTLDASGCQLLAVWLRHVKALQFQPEVVNMADDFKRYLTSVGFYSEIMAD